jgi:predicted nuclease with TOPRIM domain
MTISAEDYGDILNQLAELQGHAARHITEIEELQTKVAAQGEAILELEGFKSYLKLRLRQSKESPV